MAGQKKLPAIFYCEKLHLSLGGSNKRLMKTTETILLKVKDLRIAFRNSKKLHEVVHGVNFTVSNNEILGIVGESGSGKSVTSLALMGLLPKKEAVVTGKIKYKRTHLLDFTPTQWQEVRTKKIAMIFQEPMSALNPVMRCGKQVAEVLLQHTKLKKSEVKKEVLKLFAQVQLPDIEKAYQSYPHEISGGQMQRVIIAMAIACKPDILIADEPTTALDVTVQKDILQLLKNIQQETKMGMVFISHDLNVVSEIADKVLVMFRGNAVEYGTVEQVFKNPENEYTKALLLSKPSDTERLEVLPTISSLQNKTFKAKKISPQARASKHRVLYTQAPILEIKKLVTAYPISQGLFKKKRFFRAVNKVSFSIFPGETVGLVGESGCGKSTLAKAILRLEPITEGSIWYRGKNVTDLKGSALKDFRKEVQLIFQDPFASLNPKMPIGEAVLEPMQAHSILADKAARTARVKDLLERVGLDASFYHRYPHQLSGGQRQRVGIARAIAVNPKVIICDESVSALDISVQAQVLNLLNKLKEDFGFSYLFISHDLAVVKYMSDQLLVMNKGILEEVGDAEEVYAHPQKEYTRALIAAIPKGIE